MSESEGLRYVPIDTLRQLPRNPQTGHKVGRLVRAIEHLGFGQPLTVSATTGHVVAGNGRLAALRRMQRDERATPEGIQVDEEGRWLVPTLFGRWSEEEERRLAVALNGGVDGSLTGKLDRELVAQILAEGTDDVTAALGLIDDQVEQFLADTETRIDPPVIELGEIETVEQAATEAAGGVAPPATTTLRLIVSEDMGHRVRQLSGRGLTAEEIIGDGVRHLEAASNERSPGKATTPPG